MNGVTQCQRGWLGIAGSSKRGRTVEEDGEEGSRPRRRRRDRDRQASDRVRID